MLLAMKNNCIAILQDGEKPVMVAAMKGSHDCVNALLPVTTVDPRVADWSCKGILSYAQQLIAHEQVG